MDILDSFQREWSHHHSKTTPLAHQLRLDGRRPWVRFHALPDSKRYADDEAEEREILRRANALGAEVLDVSADCWLVECRIEEYSTPYWKPTRLAPGTTLRYLEPEEDFHWSAKVTETRWESGAFDNLLGETARDQTGPTLWMNRANGAIFAPYDGGFDIFPSSWNEVERLKQRYSNWLSSHPQGL